MMSAGAANPVESANVPDPNAQQEPPRGQRLEHAVDRPTTVRTGAERGEDKQQEGGDQQTPFSGVVVTRPAEEQLADDRSGKGN